MIIIKVEDSKDGLERALKKFKKKFESIGVVRELRKRKEFKKPSVKRRDVIKKAAHVQQKYGNE